MSIRKARFFGCRHEMKSARRFIEGRERPELFFNTTLPDYDSFPSGHARSHSFLWGDGGNMMWRGCLNN